MVAIGDRIRVESTKASSREGMVIAVAGAMLRIQWASGQESTLVPAPGSLTVLGRAKRSQAQNKQRSEPAAAQRARPDKTGGSGQTAPKLPVVRGTASAKPGGKAVAKKASDEAAGEAVASKKGKKGKKRAPAKKKG